MRYRSLFLAGFLAVPLVWANADRAEAASVVPASILASGATADVTEFGALDDQFEIDIFGTVTGGVNAPYMAFGQDLSIFVAFNSLTGDLVFGDLIIGPGLGDLVGDAVSGNFNFMTQTLDIVFDVLSLVSGEIAGNTLTASITPTSLLTLPTTPTIADVLGSYTVDVKLNFEVPGVDAPVPVPATLPLLGLGIGLIGMVGYRRRA